SARASTMPAEVSNYSIDLRAIENFFRQQGLSDFVHQPQIALEQILSPMVTLLDNASNLGVDLNGGALRIIHLLSKISAQKNLFLFFIVSHRSQWCVSIL